MQRDDRTRDRFLGVYAADELPKRMPPQSLAILNCSEKYPHMIQWNPTIHEISVKGQTLKVSNVVDIISDVMCMMHMMQ